MGGNLRVRCFPHTGKRINAREEKRGRGDASNPHPSAMRLSDFRSP